MDLETKKAALLAVYRFRENKREYILDKMKEINLSDSEIVKLFRVLEAEGLVDTFREHYSSQESGKPLDLIFASITEEGEEQLENWGLIPKSV